MQKEIAKKSKSIIEPNLHYKRSEYLILKLNTLLRNVNVNNNGKDTAIFSVGKYLLDTHQQVLIGPAITRRLTSRENDLLQLLCEYKNNLLLREQALKNIWGIVNYCNSRSMDVYITRIRKYLKDDPSLVLVNIRGKGFRLITGISK
jgi:two-component system OmpR family response regulator